ncbi:beta-L-arabinofuranosidase domain-containing protein [Sphingomonas sp.]|uniref:beta-L-arabinofuranosidase domain-containing protein n=1 Tax=Sphingomonas sp. TaxID=28214 RepID=UPI002BA09DAE|nr:beta-L-arabinofuranosidase domain-containing protein [Sphingomonas sp.]HWK35494.1 beta-L-arabinofuranosidase domain-containing protein [Sphingomonas sp.]
MTRLQRREFLLAAPAAAGGLAFATAGTAAATAPAASAAFPAGRAFPFKAKPFHEVTLTDDFWAPKVARNATVTIPFEIDKLGDVAERLNGGVLEAAIYAAKSDDTLKPYVDRCVTAMLATPGAGGENRQFELGAALYETFGDRRLIDKVLPAADALDRDIRATSPAFPGGERFALSCLHLYRVTGDPKHLVLARHYLDVRGRADSPGRSRHTQSHLPVLEQREAVGHAVNGVTLMLSMLDYGVLSGDRRYFDAAHAMWTDAATRKMYVTGGVGSTGNEGFGAPYHLPNINAYSETCAVLMWQTLNHHLFLATGDARYIDVMERGMYNNAVDGVSHSGDHFFYVNRLASAGDGRDARWQYASLECCPPNLVRFFAAMPGLIYAQDARSGAIHVNLYVASTASFAVGGGTLSLAMDSGMPWAGESRIAVSAAAPTRAAIRLRIPGWARGEVAPGGLYAFAGAGAAPVRITLNGNAVPAAPDALGYVTLDRSWTNGDVIAIELPLDARRVAADPRVRDDARRVAVTRGPIVYCAEWPDAPGRTALDLVVAPDAPLTPKLDKRLFGGAVVIDTVARHAGDPAAKTAPLKLIPYHLWANRGVGEMTTWLLTDDYQVGDIGPAGGWIFYRNPDAARDGWRYLEAAPFDQSSGAHWGCFRREVPGARGLAIGTGRQNTADMLAACTETGTAAQLCAALSVNGVRGWFLPSRDELAAMYTALHAAGRGDFHTAGVADNCEYWASSQHDADMAAHIDFADSGRLHGDDKDFPRRVRAIRAF